MKYKVFLLTSILLFSFSAFSQSANKITEIIKSPHITYGQSCYLVASSMGTIKESSSEQEAVDFFINEKILSQGIKTSDEILLKDFTWICSKAWKIPKGLFASIFKSKRYIFNEFKAQRIISDSDDPSKKITGREALNILSTLIEYYETEGEKA